MEKRTIGDNIRNARKQRGWSQKRLAEEMSVHRSYISQVETGVYTPTVETLREFAKALNVKMSVLLGENNEPKPTKEVA